jgi:hypothetical protein
MSLTVSIVAATPKQAIADVAAHYTREVGRLERAAGLTTGQQKKDLQAQARYAHRQAQLWEQMPVEAPGQ